MHPEDMSVRGAPAHGECSCPAHLDERLRATPVPFAAGTGEDTPADAVTIGDLIEAEALAVRTLDPDDAADQDDLADGYHHEAWVGDEARLHYDEEAAPLALDDSLRKQAGIEGVSWDDREILRVKAPALCTDGVLAAVAMALLEPGVRTVN